MSEQKSAGTALILASLLGPFGVDKFYVGATTLGVIQLVLTLSVIGGIISLPWALLSILTLLLFILNGSDTFLYPNVNWKEISESDTVIAWIVFTVLVLCILLNFLIKPKNYILWVLVTFAVLFIVISLVRKRKDYEEIENIKYE
jgi:TM2 domain-containing membrane protein YozV